MSNDNGSKPRIDIINEKIKELEVNKDANKVELTKLYEEKISLELPKKEEPKDFKIAEIWIRFTGLVIC